MTQPISPSLRNQRGNKELLLLIKRTAAALIDFLLCFPTEGFLQRNCTQEEYWSEPFPPYTIACGFDEGSSKGPEDQVGVSFPASEPLRAFFLSSWMLHTSESCQDPIITHFRC